MIFHDFNENSLELQGEKNIKIWGHLFLAIQLNCMDWAITSRATHIQIKYALETQNRVKKTSELLGSERLYKVARLDLLGSNLITLSVYHVGINKDNAKRLPQLLCLNMKNCYDPCFIDIRDTVAT